MITLSVEGQKRAREALQRLEQSITDDREAKDAMMKQARAFRDTFFGTFDVIERESLSLNEIFIKMQRVDENQLQVQNGRHQPFLLILDPEPAYHSKPIPPEPGTEGKTRLVTELTGRLFAVLEPPAQGLLRYYTIYGDGSWKRTIFTLGANGIQTQSAMAPATSPDLLVLEAIDLVGKVCTLHPSWAELAPHADTLTADRLHNRSFVKMHLTGLGG